MLTPTQKAKVRREIADFCVRAEGARLKWHYTQQRPFQGFGAAPENRHANDCSGYVGLAFNWAQKRTGVLLHDPLDEDYSGWGYTGTMYEYLKGNLAPVDKYLVGDIAIFGSRRNTVHTSVCRRKGTAKTSIFSSNGHESWRFDSDAPEPISLASEKAQQNLVGVYRHPKLI